MRSGSGKIDPTPGAGGTIAYLAPEREMEPYGSFVDVWSIGIIGYQLIYRGHPWRDGHERLRPRFHLLYDAAMAKLIKGEQTSVQYVLMHMLRQRWSQRYAGDRISVIDALLHPCWRILEEDSPVTPKRIKTG